MIASQLLFYFLKFLQENQRVSTYIKVFKRLFLGNKKKLEAVYFYVVHIYMW